MSDHPEVDDEPEPRPWYEGGIASSLLSILVLMGVTMVALLVVITIVSLIL